MKYITQRFDHILTRFEVKLCAVSTGYCRGGVEMSGTRASVLRYGRERRLAKRFWPLTKCSGAMEPAACIDRKEMRQSVGGKCMPENASAAVREETR